MLLILGVIIGMMGVVGLFGGDMSSIVPLGLGGGLVYWITPAKRN